MKRFASHLLLAAAIGCVCIAISAPAQDKGKPGSLDEGVSGSIEGLVRDIACPMQARRATATNFNLACALECAKAGSALIILTKEGAIYIPISDSMPDKDLRERLMPFVGKYVKATGQLYEREGTHAIAIKEIKEMKEVHLTTDAQ